MDSLCKSVSSVEAIKWSRLSVCTYKRVLVCGTCVMHHSNSTVTVRSAKISGNAAWHYWLMTVNDTSRVKGLSNAQRGSYQTLRRFIFFSNSDITNVCHCSLSQISTYHGSQFKIRTDGKTSPWQWVRSLLSVSKNIDVMKLNLHLILSERHDLRLSTKIKLYECHRKYTNVLKRLNVIKKLKSYRQCTCMYHLRL